MKLPMQCLRLPYLTMYQHCQITKLKVWKQTLSLIRSGVFLLPIKKKKASGGIAYEGLADRTRTVGSDGTVTFTFSNICSDLKLTYTEEYMEIGYYFYKDGTYGAKV